MAEDLPQPFSLSRPSNRQASTGGMISHKTKIATAASCIITKRLRMEEDGADVLAWDGQWIDGRYTPWGGGRRVVIKGGGRQIGGR